MSLATFPVLPGQGWSVKKTLVFSTRIAPHVSGREVRASLFAHTLYQFELTFNALDGNSQYVGVQSNSLQTLMGFWLTCNGQFFTFLYVDPTDYNATAQVIAIGNGTTASFTFGRTIGSYFEPVSYVTSASSVMLNGVATAAYTLSAPNIITFTAPPAAGVVIAASFVYAFQCRFLDDQTEFENFMSGLWKVGSLKFRQIR